MLSWQSLRATRARGIYIYLYHTNIPVSICIRNKRDGILCAPGIKRLQQLFTLHQMLGVKKCSYYLVRICIVSLTLYTNIVSIKYLSRYKYLLLKEFHE